MDIQLKDNKINIVNGQDIIFENLHPMFNFDGGNYNVLTTIQKGVWHKRQTKDCTIIHCDNFEYKFIPLNHGIKIYATFIADKDYESPLSFDSVNTFYKTSIKKCLVNTFDNFNGLKCNAMCSTVDTRQLIDGEKVESGDNTIFVDNENNVLSIGGITFNKYFVEIHLYQDGQINFSNKLEVNSLEKGDKITSECCYISLVYNVNDALSDYADICVYENNVKKPKFTKPVGFCTWYYYGSTVNEKQIYENLEYFSSHRLDYPIEYIQIDDGWENNRGDWQANEKFPSGMKQIAQDIINHGFKAGIWLCPYKVDECSLIYKKHPDFLVKNKDGSLFKGFDNTYCYDFSNEKACEYMAQLFHTISYDWGYRYIKIDLINISVPPLYFFKRGFTALENIRKGLKVIKNAVTSDTFILSCTSPLTSLMGLCDGMRVSVDIFERWESLKEVFKSVFKRYYYNDKFFCNDADCLIMRKKENEDSECWRLCTRSDEEIKTYITAMLASGGILMLSDKLMNFTDSQLDLLKKVFPVNNKTAIPLDIMERDIPSILDFGYLGKNRVVAFFNWSDKVKFFELNVGDNMQAFEFWEQAYYGCASPQFTTTINPHNVKLFYFSCINTPCVIGTNDVIVADIKQEYNNNVLKCQFIKDNEIHYISSSIKLYCNDNVQVREKVVDNRYLYEITNINNIRYYQLYEI